jgi:hypothetical protein
MRGCPSIAVCSLNADLVGGLAYEDSLPEDGISPAALNERQRLAGRAGVRRATQTRAARKSLGEGRRLGGRSASPELSKLSALPLERTVPIA